MQLRGAGIHAMTTLGHMTPGVQSGLTTNDARSSLVPARTTKTPPPKGGAAVSHARGASLIQSSCLLDLGWSVPCLA